jgi:hypothetical protein
LLSCPRTRKFTRGQIKTLEKRRGRVFTDPHFGPQIPSSGNRNGNSVRSCHGALPVRTPQADSTHLVPGWRAAACLCVRPCTPCSIAHVDSRFGPLTGGQPSGHLGTRCCIWADRMGVVEKRSRGGTTATCSRRKTSRSCGRGFFDWLSFLSGTARPVTPCWLPPEAVCEIGDVVPGGLACQTVPDPVFVAPHTLAGVGLLSERALTGKI